MYNNNKKNKNNIDIHPLQYTNIIRMPSNLTCIKLECLRREANDASFSSLGFSGTKCLSNACAKPLGFAVSTLFCLDCAGGSPESFPAVSNPGDKDDSFLFSIT